MNVAVIGASNKEDRYSYIACKLLLENKHKVLPVHPVLDDVLGLKVFHSTKEISDQIDTVTLYVAKDKSDKMTEEILGLNPKRIIFNPGAENDELFQKAKNKGIQVLDACTLVLLRTNQF